MPAKKGVKKTATKNPPKKKELLQKRDENY
jgi:hypothetical protein